MIHSFFVKLVITWLCNNKSVIYNKSGDNRQSIFKNSQHNIQVNEKNMESLSFFPSLISLGIRWGLFN